MKSDARGIEITEGATCVYGAPVGRSIALVEGTIDGFTPSGRVWVKIVRRAYGSYGHTARVHVGADRLVIVDELPNSPLPTDAEEAENQRRKNIARWRSRIADLEAGGELKGWENADQRTKTDVIDWYRARLTEIGEEA